MIEQAVATVAIALTVAIAATLLARPVLRRLPEPADGDDKPLYRELGSIQFLVSCGVLAGVATALSWLSLPRYAQPSWSVLAILGVLLAAIDARTSWLPLRLTQAAWLAMTVASFLAAVLWRRPRDCPESRSRGGDCWRAVFAGVAYLARQLRFRGRTVRSSAWSGSRRRLLGAAVVDPAARHHGGWRGGLGAASATPPGCLPVRTIDAGWCLRGVRRSPAELIMTHLIMLGCCTPST